MEKKIQRKVADKTRSQILKAASKLFAASGFSGTSTQAIAKAAKINETLIFHHFGNKEKLWQNVKAHIVDCITIPTLNPKPSSLQAFLKEAILQRLSAYQQKPELARLLQWQQMETKQDKLFAGNILAPTNWLPIIDHLQASGKIKQDIQPECVMVWLAASIDTITFDRLQIFKDEHTRTTYIQHLLKGFESALCP